MFISEGPRRGRRVTEKSAPERSVTGGTPQGTSRPTGGRQTRSDKPSGTTSARPRTDTRKPSDRRRDTRSTRGPPRRRDDRPRRPAASRVAKEEKDLFIKTLGELVGTRAACIFNNKDELMGKVPVSELENTLKTLDEPKAVIFDGKISSRLNEIAKRKGVRFLVGMEKDDIFSPITILSRKDLDK